MPLFLPDQGAHKKVSLFSAIHLPDFLKYLLPVVFQNLDERIVAVFVLMLQIFIAPFSCCCFSLQNCCLAVVGVFSLVCLFVSGFC